MRCQPIMFFTAVCLMFLIQLLEVARIEKTVSPNSKSYTKVPEHNLFKPSHKS